MKFPFTKKIILIGISATALLLFFSFALPVFADPPASPYIPGETLDPGCAPTDTNCTVTPPLSATTTLTIGSVPFIGNASGTVFENNKNFFWDNTNNELGLGTSTPSATLTVSGGAIITGNATTTGLTISGINGSTQCLEVDANGVVFGAGGPCGTASLGGAGRVNQITFWNTTSTVTSTASLVWSEGSTTLQIFGTVSSTQLIAASSSLGALTLPGVTGSILFANGSGAVGTTSIGTGLNLTGNILSNVGVTSLTGGGGISVSNATGSVTLGFSNSSGFVTSASSVIWSALETFINGATFNSTATFNSSTIFTTATGTLLSADANGKLQATTLGGTGLTFSGSTLTWTNPGFVTSASSVTWTGAQTFNNGVTFNATSTFAANLTLASTTCIAGQVLSTNSNGVVQCVTDQTGGGGSTTINGITSSTFNFLAAGTGLTVASSANPNNITYTFTNPGFVTAASSVTWTTLQSFTGGIAFNSTATFNSSTIFSSVTSTLAFLNSSGQLGTTSIGTGLNLTGNVLSNTGVTSLTGGGGVSVSNSTGTVTLGFSNTAGFVTSASSVTWSALQSFINGATFNSTATFTSSTIFSTATNTLLSADANGKLQATTLGGTGLSFSGSTLTWTNPGFVTSASSVTWTGAQTFNATSTFAANLTLASTTCGVGQVLSTNASGVVQCVTDQTGGGAPTINGITSSTFNFLAAGTGLTVASSANPNNITYTFTNPGFVTSASSVTWTGLQTFLGGGTFTATATFNSSTIFSNVTSSLLSTDASGSLNAVGIGNALSFSNNTLAFTNPGFVTAASSVIWTGSQVFNANTTFNATSTFNSSTILSYISGTQCLHTVNGVVLGTGSDCGSSGGGASTTVINGMASSQFTFLGDNIISVSTSAGPSIQYSFVNPGFVTAASSVTWTALQTFNNGGLFNSTATFNSSTILATLSNQIPYATSTGLLTGLGIGANLTLSNGILSATSASTPPGGSDTQIQFNNGGVFGGTPYFSFTSSTDLLAVSSSTGAVIIGTSTNPSNSLFAIATSSNIFTVLTNGNVGIGTTTSNFPLTISGSGNTGQLYAVTNSNANSISMATLLAPNSPMGPAQGDVYFSVGKSLTIGNSALIGYSQTNNASGYAFLTTYGRPASDFVVTASGTIGIGTVNPASLFTVGATGGFQVNGSGNATTTNLTISGVTSTLAYLNSSGVVGTTSVSSGLLLNGNILTNTGVTSLNGGTGTYNLYAGGLLTIATGTASTTITFANPGFLTNASITASGPITWSGSSVIGFNTSTPLTLSGLYTFNGGLTTNATATFNSSTIFSSVTSTLAFLNSSGQLGTTSIGTGLNLTGNLLSNVGVTAAVSGTNISVSNSTGSVTINFVNPGFVTSASSVTWSALQTFNAGAVHNSTATFNSSTIFAAIPTSSLLSVNGSGLLTTPTIGTGLSFNGTTLANTGVTSLTGSGCVTNGGNATGSITLSVTCGTGTVTTSSAVTALNFPFWGSASGALSGTSTLSVAFATSTQLLQNGSFNASGTISQNGTAVVLQTRNINAGGILSGGGDLSADRTISLTTSTLYSEFSGTSSIIFNTSTGVIAFTNTPGFVTAASSVTWTALQTFNAGAAINSTATFNSSTIFSVATNTLLSADANGKLQTTTFGGTGLSFAGNTLSWTNGAGFLTNASITPSGPITWSGSSVIGFNTSTPLTLSGLYTFNGGAAFNSTGTFNSSTIFSSVTSTLAFLNSSGQLGTTSIGTGLNLTGNVLSNVGVTSISSGTLISASNATGAVTLNFLNPGFVTAASSVTWSALQTFTGGATFNSTATFNSSTVFAAGLAFNSTATFNSSTIFSSVTSTLAFLNSSGQLGTTSIGTGLNLTGNVLSNTGVTSFNGGTGAVTGVGSLTGAGCITNGGNATGSITLSVTCGTGTVTTSSAGVANTIPLWTSAGALGNSLLSQNASATDVLLSALPSQTSTFGLFNLGNAFIANGQASGTLFGANTAAAYNGYFLEFENNGATKFRVASSGATTIGTSTNVAGSLFTIATSSNILSVLGNGTVGIGTSNPATNLDVRGTAQVVGTNTGTNTFLVQNTATNAATDTAELNDNPSIAANSAVNSFSLNRSLTFTGSSTLSGSVLNANDILNINTGIVNGTSTATSFNFARTSNVDGATLTVSGPLAAFSANDCSNTFAGGTCNSSADVVQINQQFANNTGAALDITTAATGPGFALRVNHNGTFTDPNAFVVDYLGNVGIGTTTPTAALTVSGGALITGNATTSHLTVSGVTSTLAFLSSSGVLGTTSISTGLNLIGNVLSNIGVTAVASGTGIRVSNATGSVTFTNTGVTSLASSTGIGLTNTTGTVTITNTGVTSFNGNTGVVTGVGSLGNLTGTIALNASTGIAISTSSNIFSIQNTGVTSLTGAGCITNGGNSTGSITLSVTCGTGTVTTSSAVSANNFPFWANTTGGLSGTSTLTISGSSLTQAGSFTISPSPTLSSSTQLFALGPNSISNGNSSGTYFGINSATSSNADLINFENYVTSTANGVSIFKIASSGALTATNLTDTALKGAMLATDANGLLISTSSYVLSFNGVTGTVVGVGSVASGTGISVSNSTGSVTFTNTGVTSLTGGGGVTVSNSTGSVTLGFSNTAGFLTNASITVNAPITWSASNVIGFNTSTPLTLSGLYTFNGGLTTNSTATFNSSTIFAAIPTSSLLSVNASGLLTTPTIGTGLSFNGTTLANTGVTSIATGTGISVNNTTGSVTISNTGVTSFNGNTGVVTGVGSLGNLTGTIALNASTGIAISTSSNIFSIQNTGVTSLTGAGCVTNGGNSTGSITLAVTCGTGTVTTSSAVSANNFPFWANTTGGLSGTSTLTISGSSLTQAGSFTISPSPTLSSSTQLFALGPNSISNGNSSGTYFGINSATSSNADLINFMTYVTSTANGVSIFKIASSGALTATNLTDTALKGAMLATDANGLLISTSSYVLSFNGATGTVVGVGSVASGTGISVSNSTGSVTFTNTGVTSLTGGGGVTVSNSTGSVTLGFTNTAGFVTAASSVTWTAAQIVSSTLAVNATATFFGNVSTTIANALLLANSNGIFTAYGGAAGCAAGNAVTAISATGTTACAAFNTSLLSGSAATNQLTFWTGTNSIAGNSFFTFNSSTDLLAVSSSTGGIIIGTSTNPSNSLFAIATSSNILTVLNNGNVGIGTVNPNGQLSLSGNPFQGATTAQLLLGNFALSGGNASGTFIGANPAGGYGGDFVDLQVSSTKVFGVAGNGATTINVTSSAALAIQDGGGNTVFSVDTSTSTPNAGLDLTAAASNQTANLLNFYSSTSTLLTYFDVNGNLFEGGNLNVTGTAAFNSTATFNTSTVILGKLAIGTSTLNGAANIFGAFNQAGGVVALASTTITGNATTTGLSITGAAAVNCNASSNALQTSVSGVVQCATITASAAASGANTQVQYNNGGATAGNAFFTFASSTDLLAVSSSTGGIIIGTSTNPSNSLFTIATSSNILTVLSNGNVGIGTATPGSLLAITGNVSGNPSSAGAYLSVASETFTDTITTSTNFAANNNMVFNSIAAPTLAAANANVLQSSAYTLNIAGAPISGTNESIFNSYGLYIGSGAVGASTTTAYGLYANTPFGAGTNYAAGFSGAVQVSGGPLGVFPTGDTSGITVQRTNANATDTTNLVNITDTPLNNNHSGSFTYSGTTFNVSRSGTANLVTNPGGLTFTGPVAAISDNCAATGGDICTSTADVLQINQQFSGNTGAALDITTAATSSSAFALRVNHNGTFTDSAAFVVGTNGNVGVGTTTPSSLLTVAGNALITGNATTTNLTITGLASGSSPCLVVGTNGAVSTSTCGGVVSPAGSDQQIQFNNGGALGANAYFTFTSSTDVLAITSSTGAVVIGTSTNVAGSSLTISASSTNAMTVEDAAGNQVVAVDTSVQNTNSGLDITAGGSQTANLLNFYSSSSAILASFDAKGNFFEGGTANVTGTLTVASGTQTAWFAVGTSTMPAGYYGNIFANDTNGLQWNLQNAASSSYSEFVITADTGSTSTNYGGLGIDNSNAAGRGVENPIDMFLESTNGTDYEACVSGSTSTQCQHNFFVGGNAAGNLKFTIATSGVVVAGNATTTNLSITALGSSGNPCLTITGISGAVGTSTCGGGGSVSTSSAVAANNFPFWSNTTGGLSGTSTLTISGTALTQAGSFIVSSTPTMTTTSSLFYLGYGYNNIRSGAASGTFIGINTSGTYNGSFLEFENNSSTVLEVASSGQLTIGTSSNLNNTLLSIATNTNIFNVFSNGGISIGTSTNPLSTLLTISTSTNILTVLSNGNVGIGTGAPTSPFQITGTPITSVTSTLEYLGYGYGNIRNGNASGTFIGINTSGTYNGTYLEFENNSSTVFRVASSGLLTIGTSTNVASALFSIATSSQILTVLNNGNVGIGATTSVPGLLTVTGSNASSVLVQDANGNSVFTVDSSQSGNNTGLDITAAGSQAGTANDLLDLYSSSSVKIAGFTSQGYLFVATSSMYGATTTLTVCARSNCTTPTATTSTNAVAFFASTGGNVTDPSIVARGTITGGQADVGEFIPIVGSDTDYTAGDVVTMVATSGPMFQKASTSYDSKLAGVITITAGLIAGGGADGHGNTVIALAGRVPVKVSDMNGAIQVGDYLTASNIPGVAMRATQPGRVLGVALEPYSSASTTTGADSALEAADVTLSSSTASSSPIIASTTPNYSYVMMFVNPGYSLGSLTSEGDIASSSWAQATTTTASSSTGGVLDQFTLYVKYALQKLGLAISNGIATVSQLFAQKITTNELCVGTTCVNQAQLQQLINGVGTGSVGGGGSTGGGDGGGAGPVTPPPSAPANIAYGSALGINFAAPASGVTASATVALSVNITLAASTTVSRVDYTVDDSTLGQGLWTNNPEYSYSWDTTGANSVADGSHTISVMITDSTGATSTASIVVDVENGQLQTPTSTPPVASSTPPSDASSTGQ